LAAEEQEHPVLPAALTSQNRDATREVAMEYPQHFPAESRARVEAATIRAGREFDSKKPKAQWRSEVEALFRTYVLTPFLVFAKEASRLKLWPVDEMDQKCREFLRGLAIDAYFQKGKAAGLSDMISNLDGSILWKAQQEIEKTSQWRKYENLRLKLAVAQSSGVQNNNKTARTAESKATEHRAMVEAYMEEVFSKTEKRITKKDFWSKAGYNSRTEFERWERQDSERPNKAAHKAFMRILREKPHLK
jgi:hypothetical protein